MKQSKNVTKSDIRMTRVTETKNQRMHQKITPPNSYHPEGGLMSNYSSPLIFTKSVMVIVATCRALFSFLFLSFPSLSFLFLPSKLFQSTNLLFQLLLTARKTNLLSSSQMQA